MDASYISSPTLVSVTRDKPCSIRTVRQTPALMQVDDRRLNRRVVY